MSDELSRIPEAMKQALAEEAEREMDEYLARPADGEALAQCCMCGKTGLSMTEDGGPECELQDGRLVCSSECWDIAVSIIDRLIPRPAEPAQAAQVDVAAQLAACRETFRHASPCSDEYNTTWLQGFDAAVSLIAAAQEGRE